ncbi:MAG: hypothetical protein ACI9WU_003528, partial [Myxococcota bacterium]
MIKRAWLAALCCAILVGCGSDASSPADPPDTSDVAQPDPDTSAADTSDTSAPSESRPAYRAIGGISMGAAALNIALQHPESFDAVGALGGYPAIRYLVRTGLRLQLAGFCPLEMLVDAPDLNAPAADPPIFCGPAQPMYELEAAQDFNHLKHSDNGANFDREFYLRVFRALTLAFGNFTSEPGPATPYLPGGVSWDWFEGTALSEQCNQPPAIDPQRAYNAEYNPEGTYAVRPLCDSKHQQDPSLAAADFDPSVPHNTPSQILLYVDLNDDGKRQYGEPVFHNANERFEDTGADGCPNVIEDGLGGCHPPGIEPMTGDPNGDDYHWLDNPTGEDRNDWWDEGEAWQDYGLDGVAGTGD